MSVIYDNITNILNYILKYVTKLPIFIDKRHLPSCQNRFVKKATIYNSGPPRNSSLSTKVKRFAFKACLRVHGIGAGKYASKGLKACCVSYTQRARSACWVPRPQNQYRKLNRPTKGAHIILGPLSVKRVDFMDGKCKSTRIFR